MICIENQCFALFSEFTHIHSGHGIHLHHILHSAALLGKGYHGSDFSVFQLLHLNSDLVFL